jgi:hypothetical protein
LYIFDHGYLDVTDVPFITSGGQVRLVTARYFDGYYLMRHPHGMLMWDTGLADGLLDIVDNGSDRQWRTVVTRPLHQQLNALGVAPTNITYLAFSHLHDDHTGNAELFSGVTVLVHAREYAAACQPKPPEGYTPAHYAGIPAGRIKQLEGDYDVFGDASVVTLEAPGHTAHAGPGPRHADKSAVRSPREARALPDYGAYDTPCIRQRLVRRIVGMWLLSEIVPPVLLNSYAIVLGGLFDVREGQVAVVVRDILNLVKASQRVSDVRRISQRSLALLREGEHTVRQIIAFLCAQLAVLGVRLPGGFQGHHLLLSCVAALVRCRPRTPTNQPAAA